MIRRSTDFSWREITDAASKKALPDFEIIEYRLKAFPLEMHDRLSVKNAEFNIFIKKNYSVMIDKIINGKKTASIP